MSEKPLSHLEGKVIAGCTLLEELGRGGSGVVYLAARTDTQELSACKLLLPECAADPEAKAAFFREAETVSLFSHENIVRAIAAGEEGEYSYFFMEYVDGETLESFRRNHRSVISFAFLLNLGIQLSGVLEYLWESRKMIHGDIKPGNLMIRYSDHALKLADLGEAGIPDSGINQSGVTPLYAPPEVIRNGGSEKSVQSDMYSCGIMLYELCCSQAPFSGNAEVLFSRHLCEKIPPLCQKAKEVDPEFSDLIARMTAKEPDSRPGSWAEVREILEAIREKHSAAARKKPRRTLSKRLLFGAAALLLLLCAGLFFLFFFPLSA